ncbi:MAG: hypothetical protein GY944_10035 [bacterium]|nr:hypothetical protein [bacterium]
MDSQENKSLVFFRYLFIASAIWNLFGAILGYFNTAFAFNLFFGRELSDPLTHMIYQGAWGTTLVYFIGYLIVAYDPVRHVGIVIVGGIGKVGFALRLLEMYGLGIANPIVLVVIIGDAIYSLLFVLYFVQLYRMKNGHCNA